MFVLECSACGGNLVQKDKFWVCENCGTKFLVGQDVNGNAFSYQPVDKKTIEGGKVAPKASSINVNSINVKEIVVNSTSDFDSADGINLTRKENLIMIPKMLENKEWKRADEQINNVLTSDPSCAEAIMYRMMSRLRITNSKQQLINTVCKNFATEKNYIEEYLSVSNEQQVKSVISLMFENCNINDNLYRAIIEFILPYAMNEIVFTKDEFVGRIDTAFDEVIKSKYPQTFEYLLTYALDSTDVDKYITLLKRFAQNISPDAAQKYYNMILKVDAADIETRRNLLTSDLQCDYPCDKCILDFENLLSYSPDMNNEVVRVVNLVSNNDITTANRAEFMWKLLGYHPESPKIFADNILSFAKACLHSSLWSQAKKYFSLLLSIDNSNGDAYWGLCMARFKMNKEQANITNRKEIFDSPEYQKALALYQTSGNEKRVKQLFEFSGTNYKKNIIIKVLIVLFYVLAIPFTILSGGLFSIVVVIGTIIIIKKVKKEKNKGKF